MKKCLSLLIALCVSSGSALGQGSGLARNVIIFVSDGCGYKHVEAANLYLHGEIGMQVYQQFPVAAGMSTYAINGSYSAQLAWSDFNHVKSGATDSAAAATALSTGVKTYNGAIGVNSAGQPVANVLEGAEELGKATGVVTSVQISHATPAGFVAHNQSRNNYAQIASEMIQQSEADVIMGCGHPTYDDNGNLKTFGFDYKYVGGSATWNALLAGSAGAAVDADHNGALDDAWTLIQTRAEFAALANGPTPGRVIGVAQVGGTLQQRRAGGGSAPYDAPMIQTVPTLEMMTDAALNVLDDDPDGFFLMVEGGAVDWAGHAGQSGRMIEEEIDFNNSVRAVVDWIEANSSWDETLVIVTGDHETGYLTRQSTGAGDVTWAHEPLQNNGADNLPGMQWNSGSHTNSLIPFYAKGAGSQAFAGFTAGTDPHRGSYIDNTTVARLALAAMKKELIIPGDASRDCKVDMLDMIFVRDRLNTDPATSDNWQADTNMDDKINILDMLVVRNALRTSCED